jgi:hypothetical protein
VRTVFKDASALDFNRVRIKNSWSIIHCLSGGEERKRFKLRSCTRIKCNLHLFPLHPPDDRKWMIEEFFIRRASVDAVCFHTFYPVSPTFLSCPIFDRWFPGHEWKVWTLGTKKDIESRINYCLARIQARIISVR